MVLELKKGKIKIFLEKESFLPGEIVKGKIVIELKKPVNAKKFKAQFICEKVIDSPYHNTPFHATIHKEEKILGNDREYFNNVYYFEFKIPDDILIKFDEYFDSSLKGISNDFLKNTVKKYKNKGKFRELNHSFIHVILEVPGKISVAEVKQIDVVGSIAGKKYEGEKLKQISEINMAFNLTLDYFARGVFAIFKKIQKDKKNDYKTGNFKAKSNAGNNIPTLKKISKNMFISFFVGSILLLAFFIGSMLVFNYFASMGLISEQTAEQLWFLVLIVGGLVFLSIIFCKMISPMVRIFK